MVSRHDSRLPNWSIHENPSHSPGPRPGRRPGRRGPRQSAALDAGRETDGRRTKFVNSLTAEQKSKALYAFDSPERTNWEFVPLQDKSTKQPTRKGLRLQE